MTEPTSAMRERMTKHARELIKTVPNARWYALTDKELLGLAALLTTWQAKRAAKGVNFDLRQATEFLTQVVENIPSLRQDRPAAAPKTLDLKQCIDPITGQLPPNPWAPATVNLSDQMWLAKNKPELADHLKSIAAGMTYSLSHQRTADAEAREALRDLPYGADEHSHNVFFTADVTAKGQFVREHGEAVSNFYKREANERVELPWQGEGNLTTTMALSKAAPELRALFGETAEVEKSWATDVLQTLRAEEAAIAEKRQAAESVLKQR